MRKMSNLSATALGAVPATPSRLKPIAAVCLVFVACCSSCGPQTSDAGDVRTGSGDIQADRLPGADGPPADDLQEDVTCVPDCEGRLCGKDGCGGSCGVCDANLYCGGGSCLAPEPVFDIHVTEGDGTVTLVWRHPNPGDTNGTSVVRSFTHYPKDPLDGELVYDGIEEIFVDSGLPNNKPCYYTLFAVFDGLVADGVTAFGVPGVGVSGGAGTVEWPNRESRANSDPWLVKHHRDVSILRPRILALHFVNYKTPEQMHQQLSDMIEAFALSSRWHGYDNPDAPESLRYDLAYEVDLRDSPDSLVWVKYRDTNSSRYPREEGSKKGTWGFDYGKLFSPGFADLYGIEDSDQPGRNLPLCELIDRGFVHEIWIYGDADNPLPGDASAAEILEWKPKYDEAFLPTGKMHGCAGNGCFDPEDVEDIVAAGCKRTIRVAWFNNTRGLGCFMESLSHGLEGMATSGAIPWLVPCFRDLANLEMNKDYGDQGIEFASWYACQGGDQLSYPDSTTVDYGTGCGGPGQITDYDPVCGNVHFMPDSKGHYDLTSEMPVLTSCSHFRDGTGKKETFTKAAFSPAYDHVSDCMGPFLTWWRQNIPSTGNTALEEDGNPMRSWWPFLYY